MQLCIYYIYNKDIEVYFLVISQIYNTRVYLYSLYSVFLYFLIFRHNFVSCCVTCFNKKKIHWYTRYTSLL